jgi:glycosyltransferase involved in cell wall biosynthesis
MLEFQRGDYKYMNQNKKLKIWILNHHASGNGDRHDAIANEFARLGTEVMIVASSYSHSSLSYKYKDKCVIEERNENLRYAWLYTTPAYKNNGFNRILNMISYMILVRRYSLEWRNKYGNPDIVIGSSVHPFAWEAAYWICKRTGADFYAEVRDLWPLSLIEVQNVHPKHPIVTFFSFLEKRAYHRAKKIITTMPYAYKYITNTLGFPKGKIHWIPNGIDTKKVDSVLTNNISNLPSELNHYLENNWCAVYTGSLVESECIDYILDAANILQDRGSNFIKFAIVGDGHLKKSLIEAAKKKNLRNVRFFDKLPKDQVAIVVRKAKVCLAAVRNLSIYKYGLSMNKLSDYLYSGNPTIFVSDVENVVNISRGGVTLPYGNREIYANAIEEVFNMNEDDKKSISDRGRKIIKEQYDTTILANQLISIFKSTN